MAENEMNVLAKWLKENVGDSIRIITPQFERTEPLEFEFKPKTTSEFRQIVDSAPWNILKGLGFRKWDSMNNLIAENKEKPVSKVVNIPILNSEDIPPEKRAEYPTGCLVVDIGRKDAPTELLEVDEDVCLIPGEWYEVIPDGFMVTGLDGEQYPFKNGESDDDIRFGCLAYGIRRVKVVTD